jgi:hypothetical protein
VNLGSQIGYTGLSRGIFGWKQKVFNIENQDRKAAVKEVFEPKGLRKPKGEQNV